VTLFYRVGQAARLSSMSGSESAQTRQRPGRTGEPPVPRGLELIDRFDADTMGVKPLVGFAVFGGTLRIG